MNIDILDKLKDANLLKKYHSNLVYDYTEYPTKGMWDKSFNDKEYKDSLLNYFKSNPDEGVVFYVHTPFCEQLCYFCLCSKLITKNYENVKNYLYNFLFKEIDILFTFLEKNKIKLNVKEIYFGGGSPTYYNKEDFKKLSDKLKSKFDFNSIGDWTVEIDPRRVDEEKLLFYRQCGVNRISFGVQDFDEEVQKRINRIQPSEMLHKLLTPRIRDEFKTFSFDLLIGLPGQTNESMSKTIDEVVKIRPTQLQTMMMHYKPDTRKYMINMLREGPLPDFYDRKILYSILEKKLLESGYKKTGFESFALPGDPIEESYKKEKTYYGSIGAQKGEVKNFIAVGSSAHGCLGDDYYFQNFYELNLYQDAISKNILPIYRGVKLTEEDKIRKYIVKFLRTYFYLNFEKLNEKFKIKFKEKFSLELKILNNFQHDNLLIIRDDQLELTPLGQHFTPIICNVFDEKNKININKI